jgi:putative peptidyl-prolyl cis-trans isomerase
MASLFRHLFVIVIFLALAVSAVPAATTQKPQDKKPDTVEVIDKVVAVINGKPIMLSDLEVRYQLYKNSRGAPKTIDRKKILDDLINEAIVEQVAEDESIVVNDARIDNEIATMMERSKIRDKNDFIKMIEKEQGITFDMFRLQLKKQLLMDQVMTFAIDFTPPSKQDAKDWYDKNKNSPALLQFNIKQIFLRSGSKFEEQKAVNEKLKDMQRRIAGGTPFEEIARKESQDVALAKNGGDMGWFMLTEIDQILAEGIYTTYSPGSMVILRSAAGYHLVKFVGRRITPFEEVESRIYGMITNQRRLEQFMKWLEQKKATAELKIMDEGSLKGK